MKTISINVMNLCTPCANRCRYCLLSYDGKETGIEMSRSMNYAKRFHTWLRDNRPDLSFLFGFGYSMDHPELLKIIKFCQSIESITGEFLQFDGMTFRSEPELECLLTDLKNAGIKLIDLTFYGTEEYHDPFAARQGDFKLMMNTLQIANQVGLDIAISIPLNHENYTQLDDLLNILDQYFITKITCFVPHSEGRGKTLDNVRLTISDYEKLSNKGKNMFNRDRFRSEAEWVLDSKFLHPKYRVLTLNLTPENVDTFEKMDFADTIAYLEMLDDEYYQTIPSFTELLNLYGDPSGTKMYSDRDLYISYQQRYIQEHGIKLYDINDERQCFSRRI